VIATGAAPRAVPGIEFGGRILDSTAALALDEIPRHVVVLGGGVIGVEFASAWHALGAEVTIVEALEGLVQNEDPSSSAALEKACRRRGTTLDPGGRGGGATRPPEGVSVWLEREGTASETGAY